MLILVGAIQFYFVKTEHLSIWKGGGFGMYSSIHYQHAEIWIRPEESKSWINLDSLKNTPASLTVLKNQVLRRPNEVQMKQLSKAICVFQKINGLEMEIWKPEIGTTDTGLNKKRIASLKSFWLEN